MSGEVKIFSARTGNRAGKMEALLKGLSTEDLLRQYLGGRLISDVPGLRQELISRGADLDRINGGIDRQIISFASEIDRNRKS